MNRVDELSQRLALRPHPEGGMYAEVYRSSQNVAIESRQRSALTAIFFLLRAGEISRWHRVRSDEAWTYVEGDHLKLHVVDPHRGVTRSETLGRLADGHSPLIVVPGGCWQAAETAGAYTLVSCFVAPGFDFADFAMAGEEDRETLARIAPALVGLV